MHVAASRPGEGRGVIALLSNRWQVSKILPAREVVLALIDLGHRSLNGRARILPSRHGKIQAENDVKDLRCRRSATVAKPATPTATSVAERRRAGM